jgi:peroxiredoxin Q/BCP
VLRPLLLCAALLAAFACKAKDAPPTPAAPRDSAAAAQTTAPAPAPTAPTLAKGDRAPDFSLMGSDGKMHALSDHVGKQAVVIAWFPKAFTGG